METPVCCWTVSLMPVCLQAEGLPLSLVHAHQLQRMVKRMLLESGTLSVPGRCPCGFWLGGRALRD